MNKSYYEKFIGKQVWLFDKVVRSNLLKDKVYTIIGIKVKKTEWNTQYPVFLVRNGEKTLEENISEVVFLPEDTLPEEVKISRYLSDNGIFAEEVYYPFDDEKELQVTIYNGDWKHGHLRADWLMEQIGYQCQNEITIGDTTEDTYDAIHTYYKAE